MRTASAQLTTQLSLESTSLCRLWRITRKDGVVLRFTDAVNSVTFGGFKYRADISFTASAILISASGSRSQSVTMTLITDPLGVVEADLRARLYDEAAGDIFIIDYLFPQYGAITAFSGVVGTVRISDKRSATIELLPASSVNSGRGIGYEKYSPTCRASLGDARCKVPIASLSRPFTVTSSVGGAVSTAERSDPNGTWALGFVKW